MSTNCKKISSKMIKVRHHPISRYAKFSQIKFWHASQMRVYQRVRNVFFFPEYFSYFGWYLPLWFSSNISSWRIRVKIKSFVEENLYFFLLFLTFITYHSMVRVVNYSFTCQIKLLGTHGTCYTFVLSKT